MQQSTLTDPCDPSKTTDDIIGEAINAMTEDCSLAAFEAALADLAYRSLEDCGSTAFELCSSTFDEYTVTGDGATVNVTCLKADLIAFMDPITETPCYELPDFCITTGENEIIDPDQYIPLGGAKSNARKQLTALAFDRAGERLMERIRVGFDTGSWLSDIQVAQLYKEYLEEELERLMTGVRVSTGACEGTIGIAKPRIKVFGLCLPTSCDC